MSAVLAAYLYAAMIVWSPISVHDFTRVPRATTEARYHQIANDLAEVALEPEQTPLIAGETGRAQTALLALAWARYESGGFRADVDQAGPSGDGGKAFCLMQVQGKYALEVKDRKSCFRAGFHAFRDSWDMCKTGSVSDRLTGYTVGRCTPDEREARLRTRLAFKWWSSHPL